jgi:hypothetical protein
MLGRPHHIDPLVESLTATAPDVGILFGCSPRDVEVIAALKQRDLDLFIVDGPYRGDYATKINTGYRLTSEPLMFLGASDIQFHAGWFEAATLRLFDGIGVVGTNDLGSKRVMAGNHSTHSLVTREYVDRFGTIDQRGVVLHEGYPHEFVDDEFVQTAMHRNAFAFATDSIVEHLHPNWGKGESDDLYDGQAFRMRMGRKLYKQRQHLWM